MDDSLSKASLDRKQVVVTNEIDASEGYNVIKREEIHMKEEYDINRETSIDTGCNILHYNEDIKTELNDVQNIAAKLQDRNQHFDLYGTLKTENVEDTIILKSELVELGFESEENCKRVTIKMADGSDNESNELDVFQNVKFDVNVKPDIDLAEDSQMDTEGEKVDLDEHISRGIISEEIKVEAEATGYGKKSRSCDNQINRFTESRKLVKGKNGCISTGYEYKVQNFKTNIDALSLEDSLNKAGLDRKQVAVKIKGGRNVVDASEGYNVIKSEEIHIKEECDTKRDTQMDVGCNILHYSVDIKTDLNHVQNIVPKLQDRSQPFDLSRTIKTEKIEDTVILKSELVELGCESKQNGKQVTIKISDGSDDESNELDVFQNVESDVNAKRDIDLPEDLQMDIGGETVDLGEYIPQNIITEEIKVEAEATQYGNKSRSCDNQINRFTELKRLTRAKHGCIYTGCKYKVQDLKKNIENILGEHLKTKHDKRGEFYQCKVCDFRTRTEQALRRHLTGKHYEQAEWDYRQACRTKRRSNLKEHFTNKHDKVAEWYNCEACDYRTKTKGHLERHFTIKHDKEAEWYQCQDCDFRTKTKDNLKAHFTTKHDKETEWFRCQSCDYITKIKGSLKQHFTNEHHSKGNEEWYQCQACDYRTKQENNLKRHFTNKHDKEAERYQCQVCDFTTKDKYYLKLHFTAKHNRKGNEEWYQCQACGFRTKNKCSLKLHFNYKHDKRAKWHQCQACDYRTKNRSSLKLHFTAQHDKEAEWYQCQACDYRTKRRSNLKQHFTVKHDEEAERYQCQACDFTTKKKRYLKLHFTAKHRDGKGNEELYQCQACDYRAKSKHILRKHLTTLHDKKAT